MNEDRILAEIRETNLSYLILAQSLIRTDRVQALYRLGLSEEVADLLDQLSPAQMMRIAQGNMLLCRFRFDDAMLWSLLADHGEGVQEEGGERSASRLHAAILRSGRFEETLDERAWSSGRQSPDRQGDPDDRAGCPTADAAVGNQSAV